MRILVVCQYYSPEEFGVNGVCESLVQAGHSVTVLTGLPNYPTGRIPKEYRWGRKRSEVINGVSVMRTPEVGRRAGQLGLAANYLSYALFASARALFLRDRYDVIFAYQLSPVFMALPAVLVAKRSGKPLFLYSLDLWPESLKNLLPNEQSAIFRAVGALSSFIYSRCDSIGVTSTPFLEYFTTVHNIPADRLSYIPQFAEDAMPAPSVPDESINFVFTGNIGRAQGIDTILEAAEILRHTPGLKIHLVGDGSYLDAAKSTVADRSLEQIVVFHGRHPATEMARFYALAAACLLTLKADGWIGLTMPGKLQRYMASGKPVVGAIDGAAQDVIHESECGLCVASGDSMGLAGAIRRFIEAAPAQRQQWGENGKGYFELNFTKEIHMKRLEQELSRLVNAYQWVGKVPKTKNRRRVSA